MLFSQPCAIVDLETTGGHLVHDRITEIGIILIDGGHIERYESLVCPGQTIPRFIQKMTGISDEMVATAPAFSVLAPGLLARLSGRLLVAHNARFDYGMLKNAFRRAGLAFQAQTLCTVKLSRHLYPQHYKHNLDAIVSRHGIVLAARHRAMADAEAVYRFLLAAQSGLGEDPVWLAARQVMLEHCAPAGLDQDTFEALPDQAGIFWMLDRQGLPLYVGRDTNIRRGVLAHFSAGHKRAIGLTGEVGAIHWQETLSLFGAVLLETIKLKTLQPRLQAAGRLASETCTLAVQEDETGWLRPVRLPAGVLTQAGVAGHFGVFRQGREARKVLVQLCERFGLCQTVAGVDPHTRPMGEACAGRRKQLCCGACVGLESADQHNERLLAALKTMAEWPWPAAVVIEERDPVTDARLEHVFDHWVYLGSRASPTAPMVGPVMLDTDICKLLSRYFRKPAEGTTLRLLDG